MDALTFGSNVLLRHLTFSEARSVVPYRTVYYGMFFFVVVVSLHV